MQLTKIFGAIILSFLASCVGLREPANLKRGDGYIYNFQGSFVFVEGSDVVNRNEILNQCHLALSDIDLKHYVGAPISIKYVEMDIASSNAGQTISNTYKGRYFNNPCISNAVYKVDSIKKSRTPGTQY